MIDKLLVRERFKKNLKTYDDNCFIQNRMAEKLVKMISSPHSNILELGCGSGILTRKLTEKFTFNTYTAIDIVEECKEYIYKISPEIVFYQSDIEEFEFKKKYDLIISNAAFQWIEDLESFIQKLQNALAPGGSLVFSTFGKQNFKEILQLTGTGLNYYSLEELDKMFSPDILEEEIIPIEFDTPKAVLKHLKLTGVNSVSQKHWTKSDLIEFETKYKNLCPNKIVLTYNPIYTANKRDETSL